MGQNHSNALAVHIDNFVPGAPVVRGPDWASTNRPSTDDDNGAAVGHLVSFDPITNLVTVRWPNGSTRADYRAKSSGPYDLRYACKSEPLTVSNFKANAFVARGPDWKWGDQDNTAGGRAVALTGDWVKVRWNSGVENSYRAGAEGKHDVVIFNDVQENANNNNNNANSNNNSNSANSSNNNNENFFSNNNNVPLPTLAANQPTPNNINSNNSSNEPQIPEGCPVAFDGVVIGAKVIRGPDWPSDDASDNMGSGVILGVEGGSKLKVKWAEGSTKLYRAGPQHYDLIYAQATSATTASPVNSSSPLLGGAANGTEPRAGQVVNKANYRANARVVRGPDWKWGAQDKLPGHLVELSGDGLWARARWVDKVTNSYRIGAEGKYDLAFDVDPLGAVSSPVRANSSAAVVTRTNFIKDAKVRRGPTWKWGNQDGNDMGSAVSIDADGWIRVKWRATGATNSYRAGAEGAHDIEYVDALPGASSVPNNTPATTTSASNNNNNQVNFPSDGASASNNSSSSSSSVTAVPPARQISTSNFRQGGAVVRGPQWRYGDQDKSGNGTLISVDASGWARVQWSDGSSNGYRSGAENAHDVIYASDTNNTNNNNANAAATSASQPLGEAVTKDNARVGAKVIRGPDWTWGNQDRAGAGNIESVDRAGWCKVRWPDGSTNSYRCGADSKMDLSYSLENNTNNASTAATANAPKTLPGCTNVTRLNFVANAEVVRGPDWKWGEQDGKPPGEGKLISIDADSWVRVHWNKTGIQNSYRGGVAGAHDIAYRGAGPTAASNTTNRTATTTSSTTSASTTTTTTTVEPKNGEKVSKDNFRAGMVISRGPDWKWGEQDKGHEGKTVSFDPQGWVKIQWSDGTINSYRAGASGAFDVIYGKGRSNSPKKDLPAPKPTDNAEEACVVCLTNLREYCCVPCGHVTLCPSCVADIEKSGNKKCPICREPYQMLMRIFK